MLYNKLILNENRLNIFHEGSKRRMYVGKLEYDLRNDVYKLTYDRSYAFSKSAISLGPELELLPLSHQSARGKLFRSLLDRIPSRENPAYEDYCLSQGISSDEKNPIILLGTIGKRGPSSFIFEPVYYSEFTSDSIREYREKIGITQHDLACALDISKATLARLERGTSHDANTLKLLELFFNSSDVALWQLKQTGGTLHRDALTKLMTYFNNQRRND